MFLTVKSPNRQVPPTDSHQYGSTFFWKKELLKSIRYKEFLKERLSQYIDTAHTLLLANGEHEITHLQMHNSLYIYAHSRTLTCTKSRHTRPRTISTFPISETFASITMRLEFSCQTIRQKLARVFRFGPACHKIAFLEC